MRPYSFHNFFRVLYPDFTWQELNSLYNSFRKQYSESHRAYHTWKHIEQGWNELNEVRPYFKDPCEAEFAWYFHDFIYIPKNKDNEQQSARIARDNCFLLKLDENFQQKVSDLIIGSLAPETPDQKLFHDVDYSILGQNRKKYNQYIAGIRTEYAGFPHSARRDFLEATLQKNIFYTNIFREKYEKQARANIAQEIALLNGLMA